MDSIIELIKVLKDTPLPLILLLSGILILILGLSGGFSGKIQIPKSKQKLTIIFGASFIALGLIFNFIPEKEKECIPNLSLGEPSINQLDVSINGVVLPDNDCPQIKKIEWDWGDGFKSRSWFPASHKYSSPGNYNVIVKATDHKNNFSVDSVKVIINNLN